MRLPRRFTGGVAACVALLAGTGGALAISASSSASSSPSVLTGGQTLTSGQQLVSDDGHFALQMEGNGDLEEIEPSGGHLIWQSNTSGNPGAYAVLSPTGDLAVDTATGSPIWSNNAATPGCPALNMQDDGDLVDYGPSTAVWVTGSVNSMIDGDLLEPNQRIVSANEDFQLVMQSDGNLVLENNEQGALWETYTNTSPGAYASLGADGSLSVIAADGSLLKTVVTGQAGDHLDVQNDGNMVLYPAGDNASTNNSAAIWSTESSGAAIEAGNLDPVPEYGSSGPCPTPAASTTSPASTPTTGTAPSTTAAPPTVTVTSTVDSVTSAAPAPRTKLPAVKVSLAFHWSWRGIYSRLTKITFGKLPARLHWTATITPAQKHAKVSTYRATTAVERHKLLLWLEHHRYTSGETVKIQIARVGYRTESVTFKVRLHKVPSVVAPAKTTKTRATKKKR